MKILSEKTGMNNNDLLKKLKITSLEVIIDTKIDTDYPLYKNFLEIFSETDTSIKLTKLIFRVKNFVPIKNRTDNKELLRNIMENIAKYFQT